MNNTTAHFSENYRILKQGVEKLRSIDIEDIDNLVELVGEITQAHKACRARIQAIKDMLAQKETEV